MKIILSGVPLFSNNLKDNLESYDVNNNYLYIDIKAGLLERLKFYYHMLSADVLLVTYVDAFFIKSVDFALMFNKKVILSWIGTDVSNAIPLIKSGKFNTNYINKVTHITASYWLKEELEKEVNIKAQYIPNIIINQSNKLIKTTSKNFSVLTRISKNREKFYGIDTIIKLALDFPDVEFKIAGIDNYTNLPLNIKLLGWIDLKNELLNSNLFIRYMEHDGESHAVIEALSLGLPVIYNYNYPYTLFSKEYIHIKNNLAKILLKFQENENYISKEAIDFIYNKYNKKTVINQYLDLFNKVAYPKLFS